MRCEHGNLVRVRIRNHSHPYPDDGTHYLVEGCKACGGLEVIQDDYETNGIGCWWLPNDDNWHWFNGDDFEKVES